MPAPDTLRHAKIPFTQGIRNQHTKPEGGNCSRSVKRGRNSVRSTQPSQWDASYQRPRRLYVPSFRSSIDGTTTPARIDCTT